MRRHLTLLAFVFAFLVAPIMSSPKAASASTGVGGAPQGTTISQLGAVVTSQAIAPGSLIQSDLGAGSHGNFEAVVLEGSNLVHYWHDNSVPNQPWQRGAVITTQATGPGSLIRSDLGAGSHGNFEAVAPEGSNLVHYWHDNSVPNQPWQRGAVITTRIGYRLFLPLTLR
jgi:hypothetical protein